MDNWRDIDCSTTEGCEELNRVIARRLGYEIHTAEVGFGEFSADREWLYEWIYKDDQPIEVPEYATDLNAAFQLVDTAPATFRLQSSAPNIWQAFFLHPVNTQAIDDTPAVAICKAWLAWKDAQADGA